MPEQIKLSSSATIFPSQGSLHILIVEDDPDVCATLRDGFKNEGFKTTLASNKKEIFAALKTQSIDLITLDLVLKDEPVDGLDLALEIRSQQNIPIIVITGRDTPIDRLSGLEKGADDYITKPFLFKEAAIRVRTVAQRYRLFDDTASSKKIDDSRNIYAFLDFCLDPSRKEVRTLSGTYVPFTETEFNLLEILIKSPQRVVSRDEIMVKLRGREWDPYDHSLIVNIARLRKKIEPKGEEVPRIIKSVRGVGYVFAGEVSRINSKDVN